VQERRQQCPICAAAVDPMTRYLDYVCWPCIEGATNLDGIPVNFANEGISGGLIGFVRDPRTGMFVEDKALTANPIVLIRGIECYADEAHFGGIVIRPTRRSESLAWPLTWC
jgi:hypothetical protein